MTRWLLLAALCFSSLCLAQDDAGTEAVPSSAADFAAKLDSFQSKRDDPATLKEIDATIVAGLKAFPNDYDLLWRAARIRHFTADGTKDEDKKKLLGKQGWDFAEKAIKLKPDGYEAHYYKSINIGMYSQAVGVVKALTEGLEGQYNAGLDVATKANEKFDRSGPHVAKGRYYYELPWPKRDLEKSRAELKKVLAANPEHLRGYFYLAETELKDGKPKEARALLDKVLKGSIDYDPPEGRRIIRWAKDLSPYIDKELQ